jgi:Domain of unknown function (DUF3597)
VSIFGSIMSKILGHKTAAAAPPDDAASAAKPAASPATGASASAPAGGGSQPAVDVSVVLTEMASKNSQKLDWRHSIVDLMKLLGLDSSLSARQELARELNYSGDTNDSAAMNIWLHRQVMIKLAENGGKVPDELRT